ncbi:hypothetical protein KSS87_017373 [Heliosperma pusillum]|nr:hypothetical protein KSS87_017373 [Heliosperma pusillum]KAH9601955.1 hypothetical protein KSS87_017373 [Heliosperma pusillum]
MLTLVLRSVKPNQSLVYTHLRLVFLPHAFTFL